MIILCGERMRNTGGCDTGSAGGIRILKAEDRAAKDSIRTLIETSVLPFKNLEWFDIMHFLEWEEH